jgi:hypothetical protein
MTSINSQLEEEFDYDVSSFEIFIYCVTRVYEVIPDFEGKFHVYNAVSEDCNVIARYPGSFKDNDGDYTYTSRGSIKISDYKENVIGLLTPKKVYIEK